MNDTIRQADQPAPAKVLGGMTPYISVSGALKAAEFYGRAFGAETVFMFPPDEQGRTMHVHLHVNGSTLMLSDGYPEHGHPALKPQGYTLQLHLKESEIDLWWKRAVDAGCEVTTPLAIMFWGDRWGSLRDPFGVDWAMNAPVNAA
ncbi:VOC family protein [Mesorhizobium sp. A623]